MPVRSKGKLLAGIAILLGLGIGSVGCQHQNSHFQASGRHRLMARSTSSTSGTTSEPPYAVTMEQPRPQTPQRNSLVASTPATQASHIQRYGSPATQQVQHREAVRRTTPAKKGSTIVASTWKPIHRVRAQQSDGPVLTAAPKSVRSSSHPVPPLLRLSQQQGVRLLPVRQSSAPTPKAIVHDRTANRTPLKQTRLKPQPTKVVQTRHRAHGPHMHHAPLMGVPGVPREFEKRSLPAYIIEPPDILMINALATTDILKTNPIQGQYLVRPDGTVGLGTYGDVYVAGMTLQQAREAIVKLVSLRVKNFTIRSLMVDVLAYNSKVFYIITDGGGYGEQVYRLPVTGNETILDALSQIGGLPSVASKKHIWIARATPHDCNQPKILPVDWKAITQYGSAHTNYQIFPGDRVYVKADPWIRIDSGLQKRLSPIERLLGTTLLGSGVVNSIRNGGRAGGLGF